MRRLYNCLKTQDKVDRLIGSLDNKDAQSEASCSKVTISLVNDSLNFQMAILQIHRYFLFYFNCAMQMIPTFFFSLKKEKGN